MIVGEGKQRSYRALVKSGGRRTLPQIYLPKTKQLPAETALSLPADRPGLSKFKWIVSTCVTGVVGICVIAVVMYAAMDVEDGSGMISSIKRAGLSALQPKKIGKVVTEEPLIAYGQKTDRIETIAKGVTTSHIIHDSVIQTRATGEFIDIKPYMLIEASLGTSVPEEALIPPFNPFELYADKTPVEQKPADPDQARAVPLNVKLHFRELSEGGLPTLDGLTINAQQAEQQVAEAAAVYAEAGADFAAPLSSEPEYAQADSPTDDIDPSEAAGDDEAVVDENATVIAKTVEEEEDAAEVLETASVIVQAGDTLYGILKGAGAENWQAKAIVEAMKSVPGAVNLKTGQELRFTLAPASDDPSKKEPVRISLFTGLNHEVTVVRNDAGDYVATDIAVEIPVVASSRKRHQQKRASLYSSIYQATLAQNLPADFVMKFLRIHAYDVDFKQKVQRGDGFQMFYDMKKDAKGVERPNNLLYAAITVEGETHRYYRFRTPDGIVDFYDDSGSNSRKFLIRKPVKGGRFTSGFGYRRHPLLGTRKMHTGIDWAAPVGTPVLAAGSGTVEAAGRKGGYGNYVRLRHGNGYKTAYAHLSRIAKGVVKGAKIRQGQIIGYVGSTGRSTGPHLHYEVLVNNRFTNPMKIQVPRSRQLKGRLLAEFQKERARIEALMRRAPVKTQVAAVAE